MGTRACEVTENPQNCIRVDFAVMAEAIRGEKIYLQIFQARIACVKKHLHELKDQLSSAFDSRVRMSPQERAVKADALATETLDWLIALQSLIEDARKLRAGGSDEVFPLILELEKIVDDLTEVVGGELERTKIESGRLQ